MSVLLPFLLMGLLVSLQGASGRYGWGLTEFSNHWKAGNEAAAAIETEYTLPNGETVPGLQLKMKPGDTGFGNASWEYNEPAAYFAGVENSELLINVYIPDLSKLKITGPALTVKAGSGKDNCQFHQFYHPSYGGEYRFLKQGWNTLRLPFDNPSSVTGSVDWQNLDYFILILWLPDDRARPEMAIAGGLWLENPAAPNSGHYSVGFDRSTVLALPGESVGVMVDVELSRAEKEERSFAVQTVDWLGQVEQVGTLTIPPGQKTASASLAVSAEEYGAYDIELEDLSGDILLKKKQMARLTVSRNLSSFPMSDADRVFWGAGVNFQGLAAYPDLQDEMASLVKRLGVGTVRFDMRWNIVEPQQGTWYWDSFDAIAAVIDKYALNGLPGLRYTASWASTYDPDSPDNLGMANEFGHYMPTDLALWQAYVTNAITRYQDTFDSWEIWNEPNWASWQSSSADFLDLLAAGYTAAKTADPDAVMVLGGLASATYSEDAQQNLSWYDPRATAGFADTVLGGGGAFFDEMAWHIYYDGDLPVMEQDLWAEMTADAVTNGIDGKPFWFTECGYSAEGSDQEEAAALIRQAAWSRAVGAKNFMWFKLWKTMWLSEADMKYGLLPFWRDEGLIMGSPASVAYQTCVLHLSGRSFLQRITEPGGVDGFLFEKESEKMLVVWRTGESAVWSPNPELGTVAAVSDAMGNSVNFNSSLPSVDLGELPCFITLVDSVNTNAFISNGSFGNSQLGTIGDALVHDEDVADFDGWYATDWALSDDGFAGAGDWFAVKNSTGNVRGIVNVVTDNQMTVGTVNFSIDVLFPGNTYNDNQEKFLIKVWGVNDSDPQTVGIQWDGAFDLNGVSGNADGLDLRDVGQSSGAAVSYTGTHITELLSINSNAGEFSGFISPGNDWQEIRFSCDLGSVGYDQVAVGFSVGYTDEAGDSGVDNLRLISVVP